MNKIRINAKILHVSPEAPSGFKGTYFIIRLRGQDGIYYDLLPSSDTAEYQAWRELVKTGVGKWFSGFQWQMEKKGKQYFNKHVLPKEMDDPTEVKEEVKSQANTLL